MPLGVDFCRATRFAQEIGTTPSNWRSPNRPPRLASRSEMEPCLGHDEDLLGVRIFRLIARLVTGDVYDTALRINAVNVTRFSRNRFGCGKLSSRCGRGPRAS